MTVLEIIVLSYHYLLLLFIHKVCHWIEQHTAFCLVQLESTATLLSWALPLHKSLIWIIKISTNSISWKAFFMFCRHRLLYFRYHAVPFFQEYRTEPPTPGKMRNVDPTENSRNRNAQLRVKAHFPVERNLHARMHLWNVSDFQNGECLKSCCGLSFHNCTHWTFFVGWYYREVKCLS